MKHGKKLTRRQKIILDNMGLKPERYLAVKDTSEELHIVHNVRGTVKIITKEAV